ncbi:unnamed protein product [Mytilus edulis]|uniref:Uncharacterized protein n=1 Tax=Mytilus edulis TaxID=6550 RepID=A0A8S3SXI4_MYTED|nr:unnamed protein product [Mytilus edulis]
MKAWHLKNERSLIYSERAAGLRTINLSNKSTGTIGSRLLGNSNYLYVTVITNNIIYTNDNLNTVTCCDFQGNTHWQFRGGDVLKSPHGISIDKEGNVYVAGTISNNVEVVSNDGKRHRQILSSTEGLKQPKVLHYDQSTNSLLVANRMDSAFVYDVQ